MWPVWLLGALVVVVVAAAAALGAAVWLGVYQPPAGHRGAAQVAAPEPAHVPREAPPALPTPTSLPASPTAYATATVSVTASATEVPPAAEQRPAATQEGAVQPFPQGPGRIVIILDDMGMVPSLSARAIANLPSPVALSFLVAGEGTATQAQQAKAKGHPVLLHLPMEPQAHGAAAEPDMGPHGLKVGMDSATIVANVEHNLAPLRGVAEGVNNHMGSRFTQWPAGMQVALARLAHEGLYFIDSKTAAPTATRQAVQGLNLPWATRDVFLDHVPTPAAIRAEMYRAVVLAQKRARAGNTTPVVVIGHPLPETLAVLETELPAVAAAGVVLVSPSAALSVAR